MARKIKILDRRVFPAGHLIIEQGEPGTHAYLIESGKVEVLARDTDGQNVKVAEIGAGSLIGEMALMTDGKRTADVRTLETTVLITISAHDLRESLNASNSMSQRFISMMRDRMQDTHRKLTGKEPTDIEKALQKAIDSAIRPLPEARQPQFKTEVNPLLEMLKSTLDKFKQ